jgi:DNA ligase 1
MTPAKLVFPVVASPKLDGIRCVIDRTGEPASAMVDPYSRSGKIIKNKYVQEQIGLSPFLGLDGELIVGSAFVPDVYNKTSSGVMSHDGEPDFIFWVFDMRGMDEALFPARHAAANKIVLEFSHHRIRMLPQKMIFSIEELNAYESECIEQGFEGVMIRHPETRYKYGRSTPRGGELLKIKRVSHDEAEIIGFEEQMFNGNEAFTDELGRTKRSTSKDGLVPADTLGAFVCRNDALWPGQVFNIAPGVLTHAERKELWGRRDAYLGRAISFKHFAHGAKDKPRHGRFKGFRDQDDM